MASTAESVRHDLASPRIIGNAYIVAGDLIFDGINKKIILGSNNEIVLDATTKKATFGASSEITLDGDNKRMVVKDASNKNRILVDGVNGRIKVARSGYDALTDADVNMAFHSDYSMVREVHLQTNPEQRFTDSSSYVAYDDGRIQINFDDWVDHNMYFECIMKTGAGTGYMRLWNVDDSSQLVEISTTSTTATQVRSGSITKPTGTKMFREEQKIVGGGGAFTDVYIGRVIFRFDF